MQKLSLFPLIWFLLYSCTSPSPSEQFFIEIAKKHQGRFDFWIKNGHLINGLDSQSFSADVLLKGDQITFIGKVDSSLFTASNTIDASGMVITPGFIDAHAHGNPVKQPNFHNFLSMGVTSICLGQDGFSPEYKDLRPWFEEVQDTVPGGKHHSFRWAFYHPPAQWC